MIILFIAILVATYFGGDYIYRAYIKHLAREMTDSDLLEEVDRVPGYSVRANICSDELSRREEVKVMMGRAQ